MKHGTQAGYKNGCRCAPCTEGARRARNVYLLRRLREGDRTTDPTGSRRRILALGMLGWNYRRIATEAGLTERQVQRLAVGYCATTNVDTAAGIRRAYDRLSMTIPPPGNTRAEKIGLALVKRAARRNGGFVPLAWDDSTIDDPNAEPASMDDERRNTLVDDIEWWLEIEPQATSQQCADRFGVSRDVVQQTLKRAGRDDLRAHLKRNAEVAAA